MFWRHPCGAGRCEMPKKKCLAFRSSSWKLVAVILDVGILMGNSLWYFTDVWFQKKNSANKRKSLEDFFKRAVEKIKLLESKNLTEWKAAVFAYTLIYPQGCTAVLTNDFTQNGFQDFFFAFPPLFLFPSSTVPLFSFFQLQGVLQPAILSLLPNLTLFLLRCVVKNIFS